MINEQQLMAYTLHKHLPLERIGADLDNTCQRHNSYNKQETIKININP